MQGGRSNRANASYGTLSYVIDWPSFKGYIPSNTAPSPTSWCKMVSYKSWWAYSCSFFDPIASYCLHGEWLSNLSKPVSSKHISNICASMGKSHRKIDKLSLKSFGRTRWSKSWSSRSLVELLGKSWRRILTAETTLIESSLTLTEASYAYLMEPHW